MTVDTPPNTELLKKCLKNMRKKIFFPTLGFDKKKLDHNSDLNAKNQKVISKNKVRKPPSPPFVWKCGHSPLKESECPKLVVNVTYINKF